MLPLKLVRSLVLGETISNPLHLTQNHHSQNNDVLDDTCPNDDQPRSSKDKNNTKQQTKSKTPVLIFMPTKELITDTYRLSTIARDMGMDLHPTPSLSHIIFSYPSSSSKIASLQPSSFSSSLSLPDGAVPLPFPSLMTAPSTHLHSFADLSKGLFKLVYIKHNQPPNFESCRISNWESCSLSLFSRVTGDRINTMDEFSRALAGMGWTLFKTKDKPLTNCGGKHSFYLYRKVEPNRVWVRRGNEDGDQIGECRIRELRLPLLDFRNAPLRILQYIILMTDEIFYLG